MEGIYNGYRYKLPLAQFSVKKGKRGMTLCHSHVCQPTFAKTCCHSLAAGSIDKHAECFSVPAVRIEDAGLALLSTRFELRR